MKRLILMKKRKKKRRKKEDEKGKEKDLENTDGLVNGAGGVGSATAR